MKVSYYNDVFDKIFFYNIAFYNMFLKCGSGKKWGEII